MMKDGTTRNRKIIAPRLSAPPKGKRIPTITPPRNTPRRPAK